MQLSRILVYPIKSLDGVELREAEVTALGALRHDREWALVDAKDNFVNGKREARIHAVRARYSDDLGAVTLSALGHHSETLPLADETSISRWFTRFLGQPVRLLRDEQQGFPDDLEANGPTLVSEASLKEVGGWFEMSVEETRRRFRSNLEISGTPAFWEDRLFKGAGALVEFRVGKLTLLGTNPCRRCAVPTRSPDSGDATAGFQKRFMDERARTLPSWADRSRFDHFYRFTLNTKIGPGQFGTRIRVGDSIVLPGLKA